MPGGGIVVERGTFHACCDLSIRKNHLISRSRDEAMIVLFSCDGSDADYVYLVVLARIGLQVGIDPYCSQPNLES